MAKGRKGRTFRKKMKGGLEPGKPVDISKYVKMGKISKSQLGTETTYGETHPINISTYNRPLADKPTLEQVDNKILTKDDIMGGKLRRTRKRRMTKRRKNSRKSRKSKSRKMSGGFVIGDYLPSFLKPGQQKKQEIFNMRNENNSGFENQPVKEEINRIEEINDNITTFSPEYEEEMKKNMIKFNQLKQGKQ
jgi:hypothetical protein